MPVSHSWELTPKQAVELQKQLRGQVRTDLPSRKVSRVAGVDVAYIRELGESVATVVVLSYPDLGIVESTVARNSTSFPYMPGLLRFREIPPLLKALGKLRVMPDLILVDGHGWAQPRRFGIACHLGLWLRSPTTGVGKSRLCRRFSESGIQKGKLSDLTHREEIIGKVLRTRAGVKPIFLSLDYGLPLDSCVRWVLGCSPRFRIPSPSARHTILRPTTSKPILYNIAMASKKDKASSNVEDPGRLPALRPEDVIYRICYARANLRELLQSAETRSKIRRLPPAQLFFSLKELDEAEIQGLLPHLTEEQWTGILDLDLWSKDRVRLNRFLYRMTHTLQSEDAVTRKLIRGTDHELLELALNPLRMHRLDEDRAPQAEGPVLETPDHHYLVELPEDAEEARFMKSFILRLYELDSEGAALLLEESHFRSWSEMEEEAYQNRKRRVEDMGFQDYYDAIEIYALLPLDAPLPLKSWEKIREVSELPLAATELEPGSILFIAALARFTRPQEMESLLEELFFVCNKLLCADRISPDDPSQIKQGISKTINGINLGLDCWSEGNLVVAEEGLAKHYLQSFFRLGYSQIKSVQEETRRMQSELHEPEPGSFLEAVTHGILERYPVFTELTEGQISRRFFSTREDLATSRKHLSEIEGPEPTPLLAGEPVAE